MKKLFILTLLTGVLALSACSKPAPQKPAATKPATQTPSATPAPTPAAPKTEAPKPDGVTSASPTKENSDPAVMAKSLSENGTWIFSVLSDVTSTEELVVSGTFHDKNDETKKVYRKLALYAQDAEHNVTEQYTLTVPKITVNSPAFRIQNGTVKGDIYVNAEGFELAGTTIDGNVYFATQAFMDSAILDTGTVTGTVSVES